MRGYMFRNRWGALFFVAVTLAGVAQLVGTRTERGAIDEAAATLTAQRQEMEALATPAAPPPVAADAITDDGGDVIYDAPADEDLIDPGTGVDPTPPDSFDGESDEPTAEDSAF